MPHDPFASIKIREFRNFIAGRLLFVTGLRMMGTILAWWVYEITRDPFAIGLLGLAEVIPAVGLALYAGHVLDRNERTAILRKCVLLYGTVALLIFFLSTDYVQNHFSKNVWLPAIYFLVMLTGAIRAFSGTSFHSLLGQLVPFEILPNATTWNSGTFLAASVFGHAAGGLLIGVLGVKGALFCTVVFMFSACIYIFRIGSKPVPIIDLSQSAWQSVKEGIAFVIKTKDLMASMILDLFAVLFGGAVAMIPAFSKEILNLGPIGFGWLNAASDIGSIITVIIFTLRPLRGNQGKILLYAVAGFGLSIIIFGVSRSFILSFIALMLSGLLDGISAIIRSTIAQIKTPNEIKGRVLSVNSMFVSSSNEFGQFESGLAAKMMGLVPSVIFGGCMTLCVVVITWFKAPSLKKLEY